MDHETASAGAAMHALAARLFPICRSLTGDGVRRTLAILRELLPELQVHEVPSGAPAFDWRVPPEWNIRDAYLLDPAGRKVVDFQQHNLHVVGYSEPVDRLLPLCELQAHLHSLPEQPDAIPYRTSYYARRWGFCLTDRQRRALPEGDYRAVIDSTLADGSLTYADMVVPGETDREVLVSTYVCHPSMANNELSGPVVAAHLARHVADLPRRRLTYRFVFIPETIGSIVYLSRHLAHLKAHVDAGFNVTCVGDERAWSYLPSRRGGTWADRTILHVLRHVAPEFRRYTFLDRGSDERQYCAPGVDLPVASLMRSKYMTYPEYHTSLDDLSLITPTGLGESLSAHVRCIEALEADIPWQATVLCEPQMGRRGLYSTLGSVGVSAAVATRMNILAYCDGENGLLDIAEILGEPIWRLAPFVEELAAHGLIAPAGAVQARNQPRQDEAR
jgi:aminopeptidase-like protein